MYQVREAPKVDMTTLDHSWLIFVKSKALAPDPRLCTDFVVRQYHIPDYNCYLLQLSVTCRHAAYLAQCLLLQVRHRCTCTNMTVCGEEAKLVETLAKQGKMPPFASQDSQFMALSSD